ncbi:MAG: AraC family transcriptional regulator [Polyangiales bacterium]
MTAKRPASFDVMRMVSEPGRYDISAPAMICLASHIGAPVQVRRTEAGRTQTCLFSEGDITLFTATSPEQVCIHTRPHHYLFLTVEPAQLAQVAREAEIDASYLALSSVSHAHDRVLTRLSRELLRESFGGLGGPLYSQTLVTQLGIELMRRYTTRGGRALAQPVARREPARIDAALQLIHDELGADLSLQRLAAAAGLSTYHFARVFKHTVGEPPHRYVLRCRIARAHQLILETTRSLSDIASAVGFADQSHLNSHLRRTFGTSGSAMRRHRKTDL